MGAYVAVAGLKKAGGWLAGRLFGAGARRAAKAIVGAVPRTAGEIAIAAGAGMAVTRMTGRPPALPPGPPTGSFAPEGQGPGTGMIPRPIEGIIGRTVSKMLPGGRTGYEFAALEGTEYDKWGRPIAVGPLMVERLVAPRGYVIVGQGDEKVAMLKGAARSMGLWFPRPKPPISGYDARAISRAHRVKKRIAKLAKKAAKC